MTAPIDMALGKDAKKNKRLRNEQRRAQSSESFHSETVLIVCLYRTKKSLRFYKVL